MNPENITRSELFSELSELFPNIPLTADAPMSRMCSLGIGGKTEILAEPQKEEELCSLIKYLRSNKIGYLILGNGTNVLLPDEGFHGVLIHPAGELKRIVFSDSTLTAGCSATLGLMAHHALNRNLSGLAFAAGIPGTLGGAIIMNAGAFGGEIGNLVQSVRILDSEGIIREISASDCAFSYRSSIFQTMDCVILSAVLRLAPGDRDEIETEMAEYAKKRRDTQPLECRSAGSTFRRPEQGSAGAMIDRCGLKGLTIGGAQVSEKHAGFLINTGNATAAEFKQLMETVRQRVFERFEVMLEPEVRVI